MDLWNALRGVEAISPALPVAVVGAVLTIILFVMSARLGRAKYDPLHSAALEGLGVLALVATLVVSVGLAGRGVRAAEAQRSDLITDYLLTEHDLIALDPIKYRTGCEPVLLFVSCPDEPETDAQARAVTEDGTVVEVGISWLSLDTAPHNPDAKLPAAFAPITVTVTPDA